MNDTYHVFVYGSLKKGFHNHALLENSDFIDEYVTSDDNYVMTGKGYGFPFVYVERNSKISLTL